MARRELRQARYRRTSGNLAYDYDRLAREERRRRDWEEQEEAARRAREAIKKRAPRRKASPRRRERVRVSPFALLGFAATTMMAVALLMGYAQLSEASHRVAERQKTLAALEEEHVRLLARYERTFDLTAIREAAERAGMAKPSASQIYYIDLSEPDNVVLHQEDGGGALGRVTASAGRRFSALLEYFR